jgi:hypothetical protein
MKEAWPFIAIIIAIIGYYAWKEYNSPGSVRPVNSVNGIDYGASGRECLTCGYQGRMKTWLGNYGVPQFICLILLLCWVVPGIVFMAVFWGKYKCPQCGALGKSREIRFKREVDITPRDTPPLDTKVCPFCAETIKSAAIVCRFCGRDIAPAQGVL